MPCVEEEAQTLPQTHAWRWSRLQGVILNPSGCRMSKHKLSMSLKKNDFIQSKEKVSSGMKSSAISSWAGLSPVSVCVGVTRDTQV